MRERSHPFGFLFFVLQRARRAAGGTLWQLDLCEFRQKMVVGECKKKLMGLTHIDLPGLDPNF